MSIWINTWFHDNKQPKLILFFPVLRWKVYFSITISLENANVHSLLTLHNCYRCSFFFLSSFSSYLLCQSVFNLQKYLFEPSSVWAFVLDEHSKLKWKTVKGAYHHQLPSLSLTHCVLLFLLAVVCYRLLLSSYVIDVHLAPFGSVLIAENRKIEQKKTYTTTLPNHTKQYP